MVYRKRRILPAKNKNDAKVKRRKGDVQQPSLGTLYPNVKQIEIGLQFYDARGNFLDEMDMIVGQDDEADFRVDCPASCGDGRMDLEAKIKEVVSRNQTKADAKGRCNRTLYPGSPDICGTELRCTIDVTYL
jgi:hypothetical protein